MITYDPRGHTWESWNALMAELFAQQQLGTVPEEKWKDWASGMQGVVFNHCLYRNRKKKY